MATQNNFLRARGITSLTAADTDLEPFAGALLCTAPGSAVITDLNGNVETVPMLAGQTLAVGIKRLALASTGTYFGLFE